MPPNESARARVYMRCCSKTRAACNAPFLSTHPRRKKEMRSRGRLVLGCVRIAKRENLPWSFLYLSRERDRSRNRAPPIPSAARDSARGFSRYRDRERRAASDNTVNMFTRVHFSRLSITFVFFIRPFL